MSELELKCPMCQRAQLESLESLWQCPDCNFVLWKSVAHRALSDAEIKALVTDGETKVLRGFKSKAGKEFSATLVLDDDGKAVFQFPERPTFQSEPLGKCPKCGADVVEREKTYSCSAWKETHCDFGIWKMITNHTITRDEATKLLNGEKVGPVKNLRGQSGKSFTATFTLDRDEGKVVFEFEPRKGEGGSGRRAGHQDDDDDGGEDEE